MKLNREKMEQLLEERGWNQVILAQKLGLDYSYVYRVMRGSRGIGKKFITGLMKMCDKEDLEFKEYVNMH